MENIVLKGLKGAAGLACGAITAELVAIGANAAFDDLSTVKKMVVEAMNPTPEKKKLIKKAVKKGGKR